MKSAVKLEVEVSGGCSKPNIPNKANKKLTSRVEKLSDTKKINDAKSKIDGLFTSSVSPKGLVNEFRKNMILLDIQTEIICEIPKQKDLTDILEIDSVKDTFTTMSETIKLALLADEQSKLSEALNSICTMANSIVSLFSDKVSDRYLAYMDSYIQNLGYKIIEENELLDPKND